MNRGRFFCSLWRNCTDDGQVSEETLQGPILQISMGSGYTMLQVSLTCKLGLKWYECQCGIENTPQVTWPMPQFGLGWYPCHAMRYATRRFAWKRLADRVSRTKTEWKKLLQLQRETQRETTGAICVKCLSRSSPRPQPSSSSRSARFPTAKGKKSTKVEPEKSFGPKNSVSCKLQVDVKITWIGSSVCHLDDVFTMSPYTGSIETWSFQVRVSEEIAGSVCRLWMCKISNDIYVYVCKCAQI